MLRNDSPKKKRIVSALLAVLIAAAVLAAGCGSKTEENPQGTKTGQETEGTGQAAGAVKDQSLTDFCADEELNTWFGSLDENTPVKMTYIIFGEAPIAMEFTDRDLILETAQALQTVRIGGLSEENPDYVSDAGGSGYYFDMEDGTAMSFTFVLGCFQWKGGEYHDVTSYGNLTEISETLSRIGNPQYVNAYAEDGGFYTECLETYATQWKEEDGLGGGLFIYPGEEGELPYVEICRCAGDSADPEAFLEGELAQYTTREIEESGAVLSEKGAVQSYTMRRKTLPGVLYTAALPEEAGNVQYLNLVLQEEDDLLAEPHLIRFCAAYIEEDTAGRDAVMKALESAVDGFTFRYAAYEKKDVQPGNFLVDFINDDRLRVWFDSVDDHCPDNLTFMKSSWENTEDSAEIRKVLEALKTVKIGGLSDKHVGGAGRRIYDFHYTDSGAYQSFDFFKDTFSYKGESYDVLDWGELPDTSFW